MWEMETILIYAVVLFGAGIFLSMTGFGFGLISTTVLFLFYGPHEVIHALAFPFYAATAFAFYRYRRDVSWPTILPYALWTLPGVFLGTWLHMLIPTFTLQLFLAALLLYALSHHLLPRVFSVLVSTPFSASLAGFANGALGTAGPPVVAWALTKPWSHEKRKAATLGIFLFASTFRTLGLCFEPTFAVADQLRFCLLLLPSIFLGIIIGERISEKASENTLGRIVRSGIFLLAVMLFMRATESLLGA